MNKFLVLLIIMCFNCNKNFIQNLSIGNVYINRQIKDNANKKSALPISAFRIEKKLKGKMLIKYRIDDVFINSYINITNKENCYSEKILIDLHTKKKTEIKFEFKKNDVILVYEGKKYYFIFSYKDKINKEEIENPYYSEDGFKFFQE